MIHYLICLGICLFSTDLAAEPRAPEVEHNKRHMINKAMQDVNAVVDAIFDEIAETQRMYQASCRKAQERETELRAILASLEQENEQMHTIKAELAMAQKDLHKAMENEATAQQKLVRLQQHASKEMSHMRDEFESFKSRLEATTNNFDKVFW